MITPKHLSNNMFGWIRDASLGNPNDYWQDPEADDFQPQEQQPDPKMIEAQQKAQAKQAELQLKSADLNRKAQADQTNAMLKAQTAQMNAELAQSKAELEAQLELRRQDMEMDMARQKGIAAMIGRNRPGGSLAS